MGTPEEWVEIYQESLKEPLPRDFTWELIIDRLKKAGEEIASAKAEIGDVEEVGGHIGSAQYNLKIAWELLGGIPWHGKRR